MGKIIRGLAATAAIAIPLATVAGPASAAMSTTTANIAVDVTSGQPIAASGAVEQAPPTTDDPADQPVAPSEDAPQLPPITDDPAQPVAPSEDAPHLPPTTDDPTGQPVAAPGDAPQLPPTTDDPTSAPTWKPGGAPLHPASPQPQLQSADQQYIVAVEDAAALADVQGDLAADSVKATNVLRGATTGLTATLDGDEVAALRAHEGVIAVEPDHWGAVWGTQTNPPWNVDRIDQRNRPLDGRYNYSEMGSGVTAYVLDTGIRRDPRGVRRPGPSRLGLRWRRRDE